MKVVFWKNYGYENQEIIKKKTFKDQADLNEFMSRNGFYLHESGIWNDGEVWAILK